MDRRGHARRQRIERVLRDPSFERLRSSTSGPIASLHEDDSVRVESGQWHAVATGLMAFTLAAGVGLLGWKRRTGTDGAVERTRLPHPGDGIGPEVTSAVVSVLEASGVSIVWERHDAA